MDCNCDGCSCDQFEEEYDRDRYVFGGIDEKESDELKLKICWDATKTTRKKEFYPRAREVLERAFRDLEHEWEDFKVS